jgi:hypothetical protein
MYSLDKQSIYKLHKFTRELYTDEQEERGCIDAVAMETVISVHKRWQHDVCRQSSRGRRRTPLTRATSQRPAARDHSSPPLPATQ